MNEQIPLISTRSMGPLGVVHLPRVWLKVRLAGKGLLAEGYRAGEGGMDGMLFEALGIDADAAIAFLKESEPDYLSFEAWVKENAGDGRLTPESINAFNETILTTLKPEPWCSEMLESLGLPKGEWLASDLNDQEDWRDFHLTLLDA